VCIGMRKVEEQNLLALVLDEMDTIIHCGHRMVPLWSSVSSVVKTFSFATTDTEDHRGQLL
jgi:hypothetical protein